MLRQQPSTECGFDAYSIARHAGDSTILMEGLNASVPANFLVLMTAGVIMIEMCIRDSIIDCPGSDDFCGSLFSAFKVADVGVMVFNAQNGWEVGSEIQARYCLLYTSRCVYETAYS